jgi:hypothetical protein
MREKSYLFDILLMVVVRGVCIGEIYATCLTAYCTSGVGEIIQRGMKT